MSKALLYAKRTRPEQDLHRKLLEGVEEIALAVASTLGPRGCNVIIDRAGESPTVTKDGVTVARNIVLSDPILQPAVKMIQAVAKAHEAETGDGTTTATILAHHLFRDGLELVDKGASPVELQRAIGFAVEIVSGGIRLLAKEPTDEQIEQVATIASNGNEALGKAILEAVQKVGRQGNILLDDASGPECSVEVRAGFQFNSGFLWPEFITEPKKSLAILREPLILVTERQLSQGVGERPELHDLGPLLTYATGADRNGTVREREPRSLLIVADDVLAGSDAAQTILLNHNKWRQRQGSLQICVVRAPGFGRNKREALDDLAMATGGRVLTLDGGEILSRWVLDDRQRWTNSNLGTCARAVISGERMILEGCPGDRTDAELVAKFAASLRERAKETKEPLEREMLLQRASRLTGQVAVLHVGASTEEEARPLRDLAEDAVPATRAAIAEGIVPGGGLCLFLIGRQLAQAAPEMPPWVQPGARLLAKVMESPLRQIVINSGADPDKVCRDLLYYAVQGSVNAVGDHPVGFDARTLTYEDLIAKGIVDPAKVVRIALEKAASIAALMLTSSCLVYFDPQAAKGNPQHIIQLPPLPNMVPQA